MKQNPQYENLESFEKLIPSLCRDNELCQTQHCDKIHPRCFRGVCIESLQNKSQTCSQGANCKLQHFNMRSFRKEYNIPPINGIYRFNICKQRNCDKFGSCQFLHVEWAKGICIENLLDECDFEDKHDLLEHITWNKLKTQVENQHSVEKINPENLCTKQDCNCQYHLINLSQFCILYFKGVCPNLICTKEHIKWEAFKKRGSQRNSLIIQSCIVLNRKNVSAHHEPTPLYLEKAQLLRFTKDLKEKNTIDIIFIMDCTESMQPWIVQSSNQIFTIIDSFTHYTKGQNIIRVGFVGYRDFDDQARLSYMDLTPDINQIKSFISKQKANGGGDNAEDVIGAIKQAYTLNISRNEESLLITYLFADAPNHGQQYYDQNFTSDNYKDKIKQGSLEELMQKYNKLKTKNYFYCVKINETTQKMYQIMKKNFKDLEITQSSKPDQLCQMVSFTLQDTYNKTSSLLNTKETKVIIASFIRPKSLPYDFDNQKGKQQYWKNYVEESYKKLRNGQAKLIINLEEIKSAKGTSCHCYQLKDLKKCRKMLIKIPNFIFEKYNRIKKQHILDSHSQINFTDEQTLQKLNEFNQKRFNDLIIAKQLAMVYRQRIKMIKGAPILFYVTPVVYALQEPFMGVKQIYAETFIDFNNIEWQKYTNNDGFVNQQYQIMTSFSHFTYVETEGEFLITDLQGKMNLLSDPAIQTRESVQKDPTNFELQGIATFYENQHRVCSELCRKLNLEHLMESIDANAYLETQELAQKIDSFQNIELQSQPKSQHILVVCDTCDEIWKAQIEEYEKQNEIKCDQCKKEENIIDEIQCRCCQSKFKIKYQTALRNDTIVKLCQDCKNTCKIERNLIKCFYCEIDCSQLIKKKIIQGMPYYFCSMAIQFLSARQCNKCQEFYDFNFLIEKNNYDKETYICIKCSGR